MFSRSCLSTVLGTTQVVQDSDSFSFAATLSPAIFRSAGFH